MYQEAASDARAKGRAGRKSQRRLGLVVMALASLAGASCLPADTRPPAGSILLTVTSADDPSVTTADGWSIAVDRLLLGIGYASLGHDCNSYSEAEYERLLDGRLGTDQRLSILFGLGQCDFEFHVAAPSAETLLGEGVTDADKELMATHEDFRAGRPPDGIAVDFAATATRGPEIKRVHWMFRQATTYLRCVRTEPGMPSQPLELQSNDNLTLHIGIRGVALFGDDADSRTAVMRFDPIAMADTMYGNGDAEVTLDELDGVSLDLARQSGPYRVGSVRSGPVSSLEDYVYLVLLSRLVGFRENITCETQLGYRSY
jgi:hypothetical protein